ncbi:MAG: FAD-dependent oxidoreductase, partial [Pseudomonadota bacterium]
ETVPFLTNETLWDLRTLPEHLIIVGGGPIGLEMAQAHRRLGAEVTVLEAARALGNDDPEIAAIAIARLRAEGVDIREDTKATGVNGIDGDLTVTLEGGETVTGSHLLIAVGRKSNVANMGLEAAEIEHDRRGIKVTSGMRSVSNRRVYAIGDVAGGLQFTHVAGYQAGLVIRNALFRLPVRNRTDMIPWATYTDPEIAHVGLTEEAARREHGDRIEVARFDLAETDRARAERVTEGLTKVVIGRSGRVLGASIAGPHAGDLIQVWALALSKKMKIADMAGHVAAYPTLGEVSKRAAGAYFAPRLFESERVKSVVRLLARLG